MLSLKSYSLFMSPVFRLQIFKNLSVLAEESTQLTALGDGKEQTAYRPGRDWISSCTESCPVGGWWNLGL